jgi:hypothetical protein
METATNFNDLRGQVHREVHRNDAVVISGAEYLRKTWATFEQDAAQDLKAKWQEQARNALLGEIDATLKEWARSYSPGTYEREIYRRAAAVIAEQFAVPAR